MDCAGDDAKEGNSDRYWRALGPKRKPSSTRLFKPPEDLLTDAVPGHSGHARAGRRLRHRRRYSCRRPAARPGRQRARDRPLVGDERGHPKGVWAVHPPRRPGLPVQHRFRRHVPPPLNDTVANPLSTPRLAPKLSPSSRSARCLKGIPTSCM